MKMSYDILSGANREELFDAVRLRHEGRTASFTHKQGSRRFIQDIRINVVRANDEIGEDWIVDGWVPNDPRASLVCIHYNTRLRTGTIHIWVDECGYCNEKVDDHKAVHCIQCGERIR